MSIPTVTIFISGDGLRVVPSRCKKTFDVALHNQLSQPGSIRLLYKYKKIFFANLDNNTLVICPLTFMSFYHLMRLSRSLKSIKFKTPFLTIPRGSWADVYRGDLGLSLYCTWGPWCSDQTVVSERPLSLYMPRGPHVPHLLYVQRSP